MATSRLSKQLRKLGFKPMPNITFSSDQKASRTPSFTSVGGITYATDNMGQSWGATGTHDLSSLGFRNTSKQSRELLEKMGDLKKPQ